jgi:hypothetical protein
LTEKREREKENEREREREREVHLDLYSRSFFVTIKHTPTQQTNTEKRILRYRDRHEGEREGGREPSWC